jgi:hypothetical protein
MSALSILEKMGENPSFDASQLTQNDITEIRHLILQSGENKPVMIITEPTDPDEPEENPNKKISAIFQ